ncbi:hypothetical protein JZ785_14885 [Alicyclobacillus curvatus]|nr:hypothetical protein JZ785_14885 [Alicyclobacillus curvatus]
MPRITDIQAILKAEASARHSVAVFLIIFTLVDQDIRGLKTEQERRKVTAMWLAWGIPFVLLAFFIITPEQESREQKRDVAAKRHVVQ